MPPAAMDQVRFVLLLSEVPGIGDKAMSSILRRNAVLRRSPEDFLRLSPSLLASEYRLQEDTAANIGRITPALREASAASARSVHREGIQVITLLDALYPSRLLQRLDDPPAVLYAYGNLGVLERETFAVANSNDSPEDSLAAGDEAALQAIAEGRAPVTGHNRPAYQRTALTARRTGASVCFVLDRGLLEAFGSDLSRDLFPAARIWSPAYDPARDLTLSPFALRDHSLPAHNRRRDTLVFALADVILAGSVKSGGQMERVCLSALAQQREVRLISKPFSDALLRAGAMPCPGSAAL